MQYQPGNRARLKNLLITSAIAALLIFSLSLIFSCGAGVDIGEADKILTSFKLEWPVGFEGSCSPNDPISIVISALDQNSRVFNWSGPVNLSCSNPNVDVSPGTIDITNGSTERCISFTNDTGINQNTGVTLSYDVVVTDVPGTVLVYETDPPSDIENFESTPWDGQVRLTWQNPFDEDFTGVRIVRKEGSMPLNTGDGLTIYEGPGTSCMDSELLNGTTYYFRAFSYDEASNFSTGVGISAVPQSHTVSMRYSTSDQSVGLYWDEDTAADSYNIYYTDDGTEPSKTNGIKIEFSSGTSHEVTGLTNFSIYKFVVTTLNGVMESQESEAVRAVPPGEIAAGGATHSAVVKANGTVWTWGRNDKGQLGDGNMGTDTDTPVQVTGITGAVAVSAGDSHTVALKSDGTVWCWGNNASGQLGDGNMGTNNDTPVQVTGMTDAVAVSAGSFHTAALKSDGTVWCWGLNSNGQLGNGEHSPVLFSDEPVQVLGEGGTGYLTGVEAIDSGGKYTMALKSEGTVWAWGLNEYFQLGDGVPGTSKDTPVQAVGEGGTGFMTGVAAIAAGLEHAMALQNDGTVLAWGYSECGQIGDGYYLPYRQYPKKVSGEGGEGYLTEVFSIAAGGIHSIAVREDMTVYAWGENSSGQLGTGGSPFSSAVPVEVTEAQETVAISAGYSHSLAIYGDGTIWCWGLNSYGQLGDGNAAVNSSLPVKVTSGLYGLIAVGAGTTHTVTVRDDTTVWTCGDNAQGQLGDDRSGTDSDIPVKVAGGLSDVLSGEGGKFHSVCVKNDTTVWTWGANSLGQLGTGIKFNYDVPVQVVGEDGSGYLTNITQVAAGDLHTAAIKDDGSAWTWGNNTSGELGIGTSGSGMESTTPVKVLGAGGVGYLSGVVAVDTGRAHTVVLREVSEVRYVWTWGYGPSGALGAGGTNTLSTTPIQVLGVGGTGVLSGISAIASGDDHTVALKDDGTVLAWGSNASGQLGDGNGGTNSYSPVSVGGELSGIIAIAAGKSHTVALKDDGSVWTWGKNDHGQLGDGNFGTGSDLPVQVVGLYGDGYITDISTVAAGGDHTLLLQNDGTVLTFGSNNQGQLGNGEYGIDSDIPVYFSIFDTGW
jgi:alpha-tubulin suppressor-like RCC1 family protein